MIHYFFSHQLEVVKISLRYDRNFSTISKEEQSLLKTKTALVVGAGGLGGFVIEGLSRIGIGAIDVCDYDFVDETNLNRQLLSLENNINQSKSNLAKQRILSINSNINTTIYNEPFPNDKVLNNISKYNIVIDCVDNISARLELEKQCISNNIPLIHGSIGGLYGKVAVVTKNNTVISDTCKNANNGIEKTLGNPFFTPAVVGSLQGLLAVKVLLNKDYLQKGFYYIDLETISIMEVPYEY